MLRLIINLSSSNFLFLCANRVSYTVIISMQKKRKENGLVAFLQSIGKCLSFANVFFTTIHLHTNVTPSVWNVAVFISTEQNGSYVIRQNNIKQKTLCVYYFLIKRKKLFGQPNTFSSHQARNNDINKQWNNTVSRNVIGYVFRITLPFLSLWNLPRWNRPVHGTTRRR